MSEKSRIADSVPRPKVYALCRGLNGLCTCEKRGSTCDSMALRALQTDALRKEQSRVDSNTEGNRTYQWHQEHMG